MAFEYIVDLLTGGAIKTSLGRYTEPRQAEERRMNLRVSCCALGACCSPRASLEVKVPHITTTQPTPSEVLSDFFSSIPLTNSHQPATSYHSRPPRQTPSGSARVLCTSQGNLSLTRYSCPPTTHSTCLERIHIVPAPAHEGTRVLYRGT